MEGASSRDVVYVKCLSTHADCLLPPDPSVFGTWGDTHNNTKIQTLSLRSWCLYIWPDKELVLAGGDGECGGGRGERGGGGEIKRHAPPLLRVFFCHLSTLCTSLPLLNIELRRVTGDWAGQVAGAECEVPQATFFQGDRSSSSLCHERRAPKENADQELVL